jgi:hypothetical protein
VYCVRNSSTRTKNGLIMVVPRKVEFTMSRTLTFVVTLDEGVTDIGVDMLKNEIIETILKEWEQDVKSVHLAPEQLRLNFAKE